MLEQIISEVKQAEEEAQRIISDSILKGKEMVQKAELEAENLKKQAFLRIKEESKKIVREAEELAAQNRENIIEDGKITGQELIKSKSKKIDEIADILLKNMLDKYGVK